MFISALLVMVSRLRKHSPRSKESRSTTHLQALEGSNLGSCGQHESKEPLMAPRVWQPFLANDNQAMRGALARGGAHDDEEALHILQAVGFLHCHTGPVQSCSNHESWVALLSCKLINFAQLPAAQEASVLRAMKLSLSEFELRERLPVEKVDAPFLHKG